MRTRTERDSLGEREVPAGAYYGIQTLRAAENFPVSGLRAQASLIRAYACVKKACAKANLELGGLKPRVARALMRACDEVRAGGLDSQFVVDAYQAGAGTSFNMNVNEVLANRALEILGRGRGEYSLVHPNDHANMAQSTNDTFPTATQVAVLWQGAGLLGVLGTLADSLRAKGREFRRVFKSARTHLQDALPITLGQEFDAYAHGVRAASGELERRLALLRRVPLGGTAVGTGTNAPPGFRARALRHLRAETGLPLSGVRDPRFGLQSHQPLAAVSSALKELSLELIRIANDLRLLSSGPTAGLAEIALPAVQPGSSIMPGKVNPSLLECLDMVCFQVVGRDLAVSLAAQAGQLDLNVMTPLTAYNLLDSIRLLVNFLPIVESRCIRGIRADEARCRDFARRSPSLAALLNTRIGYEKAAEVFKEALARRMTVARLAAEKGYLKPGEIGKFTTMDR